MKGKKVISNTFIIDKLTNSIENVVSGDSFATEISILSFTDFKNVNKKVGWQFNWKLESSYAERDVYKLSTIKKPFFNQADNFGYQPLMWDSKVLLF